MEMYLQFGHGMMEHCRVLLAAWGAGAVILSPRDLNAGQLQTLADDITGREGRVYLDPQLYTPYSDHARLTSYPYWPQEYESAGFWASPALVDMITELRTLNQHLGCRQMILPGVLADPVNTEWLDRQLAIQANAHMIGLEAPYLLATVALKSSVVRTIDQIHEILEAARTWKVDGVYLVCEHPNTDYLVIDPIWMANVLEITAGLRLQKKKVILGYCNHQMLAAACCSANAVASGTWMNVRSFPLAKFQTVEEEIKRHTKWYYCPQSLSEYKMPTLDIALLQGVLHQMEPAPALGSHYADSLFQGVQPSLVDAFTESLAFRHYLQCLHSQTGVARHPTYDATVAAHNQLLDDAETLLDQLHAAGVRGGVRDFKECIDANRAALAVLGTHRGAMLRRHWSVL
jgi:hypothetical protein